MKDITAQKPFEKFIKIYDIRIKNTRTSYPPKFLKLKKSALLNMKYLKEIYKRVSPMPKVSVIIRLIIAKNSIPEAIDSVLNQGYQDVEIIVVDDGSTDNTEKILKEYVEFGKIKYFYQKNSGPSAARNKGINESAGEYVAFLDADDLWMDDYLSKCIKRFVEDKCILVMTDNYIDVYNGDNKLFSVNTQIEKIILAMKINYNEILFSKVSKKEFDGGLGIIVRKKMF